MINRIYLLFSLLLVAGLPIRLNAQLDSMEISFSAAFALGSAGYLPHYIGFNQYSKFDPNQQDGYIESSIYLPILSRHNWHIEAGADVILKPGIKSSFFHQAFFNTSWNGISLRLGKNEVNNVGYNDDLGSGSLFLSRNARTISKGGLGIWEYIPVPFIPFLEIRGASEIGFLERDPSELTPFYHEKFVFLRTTGLPVNPFVGISHNVIFGGKGPDGEPLPDNFFDAFFARSAPASSGNLQDSVNATGAHFGAYDIGFELPLPSVLVKVFFQQPISDNSGIANHFTINKDFVLGVELKIEDHAFLRGVVYEHINTLHQSGEGLPDPLINGAYFTTGQLKDIQDRDAFLFNNLGITTNNISLRDFLDTLKDRTNFGYDWKGRDSYYNNEQYLAGNTFKGLVIGNPLFTTLGRFQKATGETLMEPTFIINNRILGHHIGIDVFVRDMDIKAWFTFTSNYGTYSGKYSGNRLGWDRDEDYYFMNIVGLQYFGVNFAKKGNNKLDFETTIALDLGDFGTNLGVMGRLTYRLR